MRLAVGSDHAGFELKEHLVRWLREAGHEVSDLGARSEDSTDYPDHAAAVGRAVSAGEAERGVLVCATGTGMAISANKFPGVRAAAANDLYLVTYARRHNDLNVLTLGARVIGTGYAEEILRAFLETPFEGGRHQRRVDKITALEESKEGCD
ncbi:MAG: ribose 5-phosphate isomerase B [Candidatus Geothermincolia bacterium]